ncbi:MAG: hypothetical protein AYL33_002510 [Candidatus Bathyarchaeota archaeon B63]|nr:MAG: hypothetical protein AYL33_002510 [Candidatus Bathyarchaeota archaeon B63]
MSGKAHRRRLARQELTRIIEFLRSVENKGLNPFLVDVEDLITVIRECFPRLKNPDELSLDAEALNRVASIIKMQSEWVKRRASSLYRDPFLIEEKLRSLPIRELAEIFLKAWRPIIELEQITIGSLRNAMRYWSSLAPLSERWREEALLSREAGVLSREDLLRQGLLRDEAFLSEIERLWGELKEAADGDGRVDYWDFIGAESYGETVRRAYLTSFLITYGYAALEIHPLEERIFLRPNESPTSKAEAQPYSFPIPVSYERWREWRERRGG